jgi:hypothetical protein
MSGKIFVAKESFSTVLKDGTPVAIQANITRVREGHELLKGREVFFKPLDVQYDIEQATAAPAEVRKAAPSPYVKPGPKPKGEVDDGPEPEPAEDQPEG